MFERLALIGCGLMGGSFALAARRAGIVARVIGCSHSGSSVATALRMGVIDAGADSAADAAAGADLVLVAVPVAAMEAVFAALAKPLAPGALVLDVGSTKRDVIAAARRALGARNADFVPCHPIAGAEAAGVRNARADLYAGHRVVLTPIDATAPNQIERARAIWEALGCLVTQMAPAAHDAALAAVSHLPHLLAFAYMQGITAQADGTRALALAGPGFRDFSRIAASEPHVWRDILLANRSEIGAQLSAFRGALAQAERILRDADAAALERWITAASQARAGWHEAAAPARD